MKQTALHSQHVALQAKMVDFSGYSMPLQYQSQLQEHRAVRQYAGIFDVSHMVTITITGNDTLAFIRHLVANDIQQITAGKAMYTCMLNPDGGVIDDLIVYYFNDQHCRLIVNAACASKDIAWMQQVATAFNTTITTPPDMAILAIQGPQALALAPSILPAPYQDSIAALKPFHTVSHDTGFIARTGYTGEDGFEIVVPNEQAMTIWQRALQANIMPCGLAARDTLRIEAGLNLYGQDMDEDTSPLIANLQWTVSLKDKKRDFIGKQAFIHQMQRGIEHKLVGIAMTQAGVLRNQQAIAFDHHDNGIITSGSFSPTLNHAIGFARVPIHAPTTGIIEHRKKITSVYLTALPFVRKGQACQTIPL